MRGAGVLWLLACCLVDSGSEPTRHLYNPCSGNHRFSWIRDDYIKNPHHLYEHVHSSQNVYNYINNLHHLNEHIQSSQHFCYYIKDLHHLEDHVHSSQHFHNYIRDLHHLDEHVHSSQNFYNYINHLHHLKDHVHSSQHFCDYIKDLQHLEDHVHSSQHNHCSSLGMSLFVPAYFEIDQMLGGGGGPISFPELCYNGGFHDGVKCICPDSLFYGPKCEFPVPEITVPVGPVAVAVAAQVRITNQNFTEELKDPQSEDYRALEKDFKEKMDTVYKDIPGYREVVILRLRSGSIIVDHEVVVDATVNNDVSIIDATILNVTEAVREQLITLNSTEKKLLGEKQVEFPPPFSLPLPHPDPGNSPSWAHVGAFPSRVFSERSSEICFTAPPDPILNATSSFSAEDSCRKMAEAQFPEFAPFYYPLVVGGALRCVSDCSSESPRAIDCHHGACHVSRGGPQCNCNDPEVFWYLDRQRCQSRVQKSELGLGLGLAALTLACALLAAFLLRAHRTKGRSNWPDDAEAWYEEVEEWSPSGGLAFRNEGAHAGGRSQSSSSSSSREAFRPSLQAVDTSIKVRVAGVFSLRGPTGTLP
ncbi:UNVERIFIED_CONTAM: hypothetical protein K2H54_040382 [Gekko kuhli]